MKSDSDSVLVRNPEKTDEKLSNGCPGEDISSVDLQSDSLVDSTSQVDSLLKDSQCDMSRAASSLKNASGMTSVDSGLSIDVSRLSDSSNILDVTLPEKLSQASSAEFCDASRGECMLSMNSNIC